MTAPAALDRAAFDALVQRRTLAIVEATAVRPADRRREATQEAQLLEAAATEFADAVDRSGKELPYDEAVVVTGGAGPVVVTEKEWKDNPAYWEAVAAGATGQVDSLTQGSVLVRYLRGEPDSPAS
jgi:hypothetical protein